MNQASESCNFVWGGDGFRGKPFQELFQELFENHFTSYFK
jgi:hypothetical protein